MTELFKFKSREQALAEIDRRLMAAMQPTAPNTGQLLSRMREVVWKRQVGAGGTQPPVAQ